MQALGETAIDVAQETPPNITPDDAQDTPFSDEPDDVESPATHGVQAPGEVATTPEAEFLNMVEKYSDIAYRVLWKMLGNKEDVEDALQYALLKAWRTWPASQDRVHDPKNWLLRIVSNTARDKLRHGKLITYVPYQDQDPDSKGQHSKNDFGDIAAISLLDTCDIEHEVIVREEVRAILRRMPSRYRAAVLMHDFYDYGPSEVAEALGLSVSGMKMFLSRARQSFREQAVALGIRPHAERSA